MNIPKPIIPKEHGSWPILLVPMIASAAVASSVSWMMILLLLSSLTCFMAYLPLERLLRNRYGIPVSSQEYHAARFWSLAYVSLGAVFALPVLLAGYMLLVVIGALAAASFLFSFFLKTKLRYTLLGNLVAVIGLTLTGPAASYVLKDSLDTDAFVLWILNVLFFGAGIVYVHMKLRAKAAGTSALGWRARLSIGRLNLIYHLFVTVIVLVLVALHRTPLMVIIAFVPMMIHAFVGTLRMSSDLKFRRIGLLLLTHSFVFALILIVVMRGGQ